MAKNDEDDEPTDDGVYVGCKIDKATHDAFMRACFEVYGPREGRAAPVLRLLIRSWTQNPKKIKEVTT